MCHGKKVGLQLTLDFNAVAAARARAEAIATAEAGATEWWLDYALGVVRSVAKRQELLTTDDIWRDMVHQGDQESGEPRALGAVMLRAKREGLIAPTAMHKDSERAVCHGRPLRVWRSLVVRVGVGVPA